MELTWNAMPAHASLSPRSSVHVAPSLTSIAEEKPARRIDAAQESFLLDANDSDHASEVFIQPVKRQRLIYSCDVCGTTYTEKRALARHRHTDLHRQRIGLPPIKKHPCSVCGKLFTRGHDRQRHENEKHRGVRRFPPVEEGGAAMQFDSYQDPEGATAILQDAYQMIPEAVMPFSLVDDERWGTEMSATLPFLKSSITSEPGHRPKAKDRAKQRSKEPQVWTPSTVYGSPDNISPKNTLRQPQAPAMRQYQDAHADDSHVMAVSIEHEKSSREDSAVEVDSRSDSPESGVSSETGDTKRNYQGSCRDENWPFASQSPRKTSFQKSLSRVKPACKPTICIVCDMPFEEDMDELLPHLRQHLDTFQGKHKCSDCQVGFVHKQDLVQHLQSAARGTCGFNFIHSVPCTGHHPPAPSDDSVSFNDSEHFRLWNQLRNWEQSQLRAYMDEVKALVSLRQAKDEDCDCYSIEALLRSNRDSLNSFAISVNTHASAPCDVAADGKYDIGGLQKRLRLMSLGNPKAHVRHLVSKRTVQTPRVGMLNKSLTRAVNAGDLDKVEELLDLGAEKSIGSGNQAELTATALWGRQNSSKTLAAHSVQETLWGHCQECGTNNDALKKDIHMVTALLKHSADPNFVGGLCGSPLASAAWMGRPDIVITLLQHGAHVDRADNGKYASPLCAAVAQAGDAKSLAVVSLLVESGADVEARNEEGSALEIVKRRREFWERKAMDLHMPFNVVSQLLTCCDRTRAVLEKATKERARIVGKR